MKVTEIAVQVQVRETYETTRALAHVRLYYTRRCMYSKLSGYYGRRRHSDISGLDLVSTTLCS